MLLKWFEDFLSGRKQRVIVNEECLQWSDVQSGVPQGSILAPIPFVIYINDMPDVTNHCELVMFVDDEMNGADEAFKIDTVAQCNVVPKHFFQKLSPKPKIKPATIKLSAYNGTSIPVSGKCIGKTTPLTCSRRNHFMIRDGWSLLFFKVECLIWILAGQSRRRKC